MSTPDFTVLLSDIQAMQQDRISDASYEERKARVAYDQVVDEFDMGWARYSEVLAKEAQWHDKLGELQQLQSEAL